MPRLRTIGWVLTGSGAVLSIVCMRLDHSKGLLIASELISLAAISSWFFVTGLVCLLIALWRLGPWTMSGSIIVVLAFWLAVVPTLVLFSRAIAYPWPIIIVRTPDGTRYLLADAPNIETRRVLYRSPHRLGLVWSRVKEVHLGHSHNHFHSGRPALIVSPDGTRMF